MAFYSAPCTGIFSRFDFSFPCNFYIRKPCGTTNIPLDQENCGACSLLKFLMAASTRSEKTGRNLPFSSKMADICLQIKCREQRDYPPCHCLHAGFCILRYLVCRRQWQKFPLFLNYRQSILSLELTVMC